MRAVTLVFTTFLIGTLPLNVRSADSAKLPLNVLYLGRQKEEKRTDAFVEFLSSRFVRCTAAKRDDFQVEMLSGIDVVLVDWPQQERLSSNYSSPVGPLENWKTPTVLLGSAGLIMAGPWSVIGGAG
jgi:hypothetical protein